jgi:branched-chain amino acid transport system substrate-binding protein
MNTSRQSFLLPRLWVLFPVSATLLLSGCADTFTQDVFGNKSPSTEASPHSGVIDRTKDVARQGIKASKPPAVNLAQNEHLVALILPSQAANPRIKTVATSMLKAAQMAEKDLHENRLKLYILETDDSAGASGIAAKRAIEAGADLILGPLLKDSVREVQEATVGKNIPMIAFSSDSSVASSSTYLLSYLPEQDVGRLLDYTQSKGIKTAAILYPQDAYGDRLNTLFSRMAGGRGITIASSASYEMATLDSQTKKLLTDNAFKSNTPNALFIPEKPSALKNVLASLKKNGLDSTKTSILGTGLWQDPSILQATEGVSGHFPTPAEAPMKSFLQRYKTAYKTAPSELAALSYDAVTLAGGLIARSPQKPYTGSQIAHPNGFSGVTGLFRFTPQGLSERGLSMTKVENKKLTTEVNAPSNFDKSTPMTKTAPTEE